MIVGFVIAFTDATKMVMGWVNGGGERRVIGRNMWHLGLLKYGLWVI